MRKAVAVTAFALVLGVAPSATAHPSEGRNENGFGGGPHCHVVVANDQRNPAYPSHTGHTHAGNDVFNADPNCDGDAGN
nr:hypothetical protein [Actinomycetota bacterium]